MKPFTLLFLVICILAAIAGVGHSQQRQDPPQLFIGDNQPGKCKPGDLFIILGIHEVCQSDGLNATQIYTVQHAPTAITAAQIGAGTGPTITGCGTISAQSPGKLAGIFTTSATSCTADLTALPAATTGYSCLLWDRTAATGLTFGNLSSTSTSATFPTITTVAADVLAFQCGFSY